MGLLLSSMHKSFDATDQADFVLQVARKGTGFLTANDLQAMVSDEEEEDQPLYSPV